MRRTTKHQQTLFTLLQFTHAAESMNETSFSFRLSLPSVSLAQKMPASRICIRALDHNRFECVHATDAPERRDFAPAQNVWRVRRGTLHSAASTQLPMTRMTLCIEFGLWGAIYRGRCRRARPTPHNTRTCGTRRTSTRARLIRLTKTTDPRRARRACVQRILSLLWSA